jgi:hypothetical protein
VEEDDATESSKRPVPSQTSTFAAHNVVAVLPDMDEARGAIDALSRAGIDGAKISLLGPAAEEADRPDTAERDEMVTRRVEKRAAIGAATGTATGGAIGFLAGLAAFAIPGVGPVVGTGVWAATIGGGVAGGAVGGVVGGISSFDMTEAWELTHESVGAGHVLVGVHAKDAAEVDKGARILEEREPLRIERYDSKGRRIPTP